MKNSPLPPSLLPGAAAAAALPAPLVDWLAATVRAQAEDGAQDASARAAEAWSVLPAGWPPPEQLGATLAAVDALEAEALHGLLEQGTLDAHTLDTVHAAFARVRRAIAERMQAPEAAAGQGLQHALAARDRQLSIATHELRTPISSILLNLQMLERAALQQGTMDADAITRLLAVPSRQLRRLVRMVDLLLDSAQVESDRLVLHRQPLDLCQVVHDAVGRMQQLARAAHCTIDLAGCQPVPGRWDRLRLEQVVTNLVTNGIKYGGGRVAVRTWQAGSTGFIEVRDQGDGIAAEDHERIFEPYLRLPSTGSEEGAGLGLYIVREIVLAHGGAIRVDSPPGAGAIFTVELPA